MCRDQTGLEDAKKWKDAFKEEKKLGKLVRSPCTMAGFKQFYDSVTPIKAEEMQNGELRLVGPICSTGKFDGFDLSAWFSNALMRVLFAVVFRKESAIRCRELAQPRAAEAQRKRPSVLFKDP